MKSKILELARQRQKEGHSTFLSPDHKLPLSRREFLAAGLRDTAVFVAMPTIFDLLFRSSTAQAATIKPATIFFNFDASGGSGHRNRNFQPATTAGSTLSSAAATKMGIAAGQTYSNKFGAPMATGTGTAAGFFNQLSTAAPTGGAILAPATGQGLIQFASFRAITNDDTSGNTHSPMNLISAYLAMKSADAYYIQAGNAIGNGTNRANFGGNSGGPLAAMKAMGWLPVNNSAAVLNAVSFPGVFLKKGLAVTALSHAKTMAANRMARMNASSANMALATQQKSGVEANYQNAVDGQSLTLDPAADLDASTNSILDTGLGATNAENIAFKAALAAAVKGISRPMVTVVLNGGDYHTGNQADEDAFVKREVTMVRAAANECLKKGITGVFSFITDGAMNATSNLAYVSDEGRFSNHLVAVASATPAVVKKPQLGAVDPNSGFASAASGPFVDNNQILAVALFASMLSASGDPNWLQNVKKIIPASVAALLTDQQIAAMNAFV